MKIEGQYFAPLTSKSSASTLLIADGNIHVELNDGTSVDQLAVASIQGSTEIHFKCGSYFKSDNALPNEAYQQLAGSVRRKIAWLEKFSVTRVAVLGLILVISLLVYKAGFSAASAIVVEYFPLSWESEIGENAYRTIQPLALSESELSFELQEQINEQAKTIAQQVGIEQQIRVFIHHSEFFDANALAFPGGLIVLTDRLVELLSHEELMAVVAHELAHIEQRHSLQQALDVLGATAIALMIFGASESLIEEFVAVVVDGLLLANSRDLEKEADLEAIRILTENGIDPSLLVNSLEKLVDYYCSNSDSSITSCDDTAFSWLSTHPTSDERSEYLKEEIARLAAQ